MGFPDAGLASVPAVLAEEVDNSEATVRNDIRHEVSA